jgi:type I restriction enzyme S subunit
MNVDGLPVPDIAIEPPQWGIVRDILRQHVPQFDVFAFGSRAKRTAKPYSDLDLAIMTITPLPLSVGAALAEAFSESDLPWKVDVVDWAATGGEFRAVIERGRVLLQRGAPLA